MSSSIAADAGADKEERTGLVAPDKLTLITADLKGKAVCGSSGNLSSTAFHFNILISDVFLFYSNVFLF